jgi:NAD(P)-dependent dehydrogenase (short-subunit alcohol dehydrogenase family)
VTIAIPTFGKSWSMKQGMNSATRIERDLTDSPGTRQEDISRGWGVVRPGFAQTERFGDGQELIGTVVFPASTKASSFITGADVRVDGGFLCQSI